MDTTIDLRLNTASDAIAAGVDQRNICSVPATGDARFAQMAKTLLYDKSNTKIHTKSCSWGTRGYHYASSPAFECQTCHRFFQACGRSDRAPFYWADNLDCDCSKTFGAPPGVEYPRCGCEPSKVHPFLPQHAEELVRDACAPRS